MISPTQIVAYLALFSVIGFGFLFVNLLVGRFLRPDSPNTEKLEVYECGEPTIGSSFVQFDLRFYVVALLFIIFDVEIAFFFPWATVFGKSTQLMDERLPQAAAVEARAELGLPANSFAWTESQHAQVEALSTVKYGQAVDAKLLELGVSEASLAATGTGSAEQPGMSIPEVHETARRMALFSMFDIGVFFAVLMVGFAYVWKRGDLDWVRAVSKERASPPGRAAPRSAQSRQPALVGHE